MGAVLLAVTAVVILYVAGSMYRSIPESISATYYELGRRGWIFVVFMSSVAAMLFPVWLSASQDSHHCLVFLSCAALLFVAVSPCFREDLQGRVHYGSAALCCTCTVLWQILEGLWDVTLWFAFIGGMLTLKDRSKWCWWLECAVMASLLCNLWRIL